MKFSQSFKITISLIALCLLVLFFLEISNNSSSKLGCAYRHIQKTINKNWQKNNCQRSIDLMPPVMRRQKTPCGCEGYTMPVY